MFIINLNISTDLPLAASIDSLIESNMGINMHSTDIIPF